MKKSFKILSTLALVFMATIAMASQLDWNIVQSISTAFANLPQDGINHITWATGTVVTGGTLTQQAAVGDPTGVGTAEDTAHQYLDMRDVERKVLEYKPYQTPIVTWLSSNADGTSNIGTTDSWEHKYYAVDARGMKTTVSSAGAIDGTTKITVLTVADGSIFTLYNNVYFTGITTATTMISSGRFLVGEVSAISGNSVTVKLLNPGTTLANTDLADQIVYRGASGMNYLAASTSAWGILPEPDYNFVQLFMEQVEEGEIQGLIKKEADWGFADLKRMAIEDFKIQRERAFLAGLRSQFNLSVNSQTQRFYNLGGILNDTGVPALANQNLATLGADTFVYWLKTIFTGNNGSPERFFLTGADMTEAIEKVKVDNKWLLAKESDIVMGIKTVKLVSSFGSLQCRYYEQLDLLGMPKNGLVLDAPNLKILDLAGKGFNINNLDYKSSGIKNVNAATLTQASTLLVKNKNTHRIIMGV